ncbi:MAG: alginate export family protein [Myxococcota bacterium]
MYKALIPSIFVSLFGAIPASADEEPARPRILDLRAEEDWRALRGDGGKPLPLDGLKYISLDDDAYLTLGGQLRLAYELFINERYGEVEQDDSGSLLLRMMPHLNFRLGPAFRVFAELKSTHEAGRDGGGTPVDVDRLDAHQLFVEAALGDPRQTAEASLALRLGRQELFYGVGRLIDVRDGPPVRRTFDSVRLRFDSSVVRADVLAALEVPTRPGVFDDGFNDDGAGRPRVWGGYAQTKPIPLGAGYGLGFDLYYIGAEQAGLVFADGTGEEIRHSVGGRWWTQSRTFRHEFEGTYQRGTLEDADTGVETPVEAWGVEGSVGYTFADLETKPTFQLTGGAQSGDGTPGDGRLGTYRAPFPNLRWAGATTGVGPGNGFGGTFSAGFNPREDVNLTTIARIYSRLELRDAPYTPAGFPIRVNPESRARFLGASVSLNVTWRPHPYVTTYLRGEYFEPGTYLEDTPPAKKTGFATVGSDLKF